MSRVVFDHSKLKGRAREKGYTLETLSKATGISVKTISNKWNGKGYFTDAEIFALKTLLDIESIEDFFLAIKV